jgi:hypothetical protein
MKVICFLELVLIRTQVSVATSLHRMSALNGPTAISRASTSSIMSSVLLISARFPGALTRV